MGRLDRSFRHLGDAFCVRYVVVNDRMLPSQPLLQKGADLWTSIDTIHHTRDTYALTQTHKGAMHREQSAGDGQRAHRRKRCVDSDVRQTAWTVPLQDRCGAAAICANANPSRVNASMRHGCTRPCTSFAATALQPTQLSASEADSELIAGAAAAQSSQPTGLWQPYCC